MEEKQKTPILKGRGALLAAAMKKMQESKPGGSGDASTSTEPPKPRGRAAYIDLIKKKAESKIGQSSASTPSHTGSSDKDDSVSVLSQQTAEIKLDSGPLLYKGESGKLVPASANYIQLKLEPNRGVYEYEVIFQPDVDSRKARFQILNKVISEISKTKTFDGRILYLPLKCFNTEKTFSCTHPFNDEPIQMTIIYKKQKQMDDCIQLYNILFKRIMQVLAYHRVGRQYFDNRNPFLIPQHRLEIWPGYVAAVHEFNGGVMLCLNVQHRVLRTQNALEFIQDLIQQNRQRYKQLMEKAFLGSSVLTRYNNKTYIIHDIMWDSNPKSKFETSTGAMISFEEYYKKQYDLQIQDLNQPMLMNRQSVFKSGQVEKEDRYIMLVPELCFMTGLTDELRSDYKVMKDVAQYTRVTPNQRMNSLRKFTQNLNNNPDAREILSAWGLSLSSATVDLQMRVLGPEEILFGNDVHVHGTANADWTSAAMRNRVLTSIDFRNWIVLHTQQDRNNMENFVQAAMRLGPKMGIVINKPNVVCLRDDRNESYIHTLQEKINPNLQFVCIICPTIRDDRYSTIKRICCAKNPIASQVINSRTLRNPSKLPAIVQKIVLQINCKLGGSLWSVRFPLKGWMICGIDVYHSKSASNTSVCGFVSSLTDSMSKWFSTCCFHNKDKEIGDHLKPLLFRSLQEYHACNGAYPKHIIVYRDGLGDGQLGTCKNFEIPQLLTAIKEIGEKIDLCYIVVQKQINARIFMNKGNEVDNPEPGSIVDDTITRQKMKDFYLVAQQVRQGTVTPTHYIVLHDDANIKPDNIQRLSFKMCHMYYNWTGTIRVPAPCQYAHKLAYLIGQNVHAEHSRSLAHTLFYL